MENSRLSFDEDVVIQTDDAVQEAEHIYLHDWTPERQNVSARPAPGPAFEPPVDPFAQVRELERTQGLPRKSLLGGTFANIPLPTTQSDSAQLVDYWKKANRAGVPVTANDLETYVDLLGDRSGRSVLIDNREGPGLSPGLQKMGQVFAKQHPAELKRTQDDNAVARMSMRDAREELFPDMCADIDPARVTADRRAFAQNMSALAKLPPLPKDASPQTLSEYRDAARAAGVRLQIQHIEEHRFEGRVPYRGPGEPQPLGLTVLKELDKPVGERHLFKTDSDTWSAILSECQPLPVPRRAVEQSEPREAVRDERPDEPAYGMSPSTLPEPPHREQPVPFVPARDGGLGSSNAVRATELTELASRPSTGERPVTAPAQRFKSTEAHMARKGPAPAPPRH